jgi:hypothetical protein
MLLCVVNLLFSERDWVSPKSMPFIKLGLSRDIPLLIKAALHITASFSQCHQCLFTTWRDRKRRLCLDLPEHYPFSGHAFLFLQGVACKCGTFHLPRKNLFPHSAFLTLFKELTIVCKPSASSPCPFDKSLARARFSIPIEIISLAEKSSSAASNDYPLPSVVVMPLPLLCTGGVIGVDDQCSACSTGLSASLVCEWLEDLALALAIAAVAFAPPWKNSYHVESRGVPDADNDDHSFLH